MANVRFQLWRPWRDAFGRLNQTDLLVLAVWCGLITGELEVASLVVPRALRSTPPLHGITRHFVWLAPLISVLLSLGVAVLLVPAMRLWPRRAAWLSLRAILSLAIVQVLFICLERVYLDALLVFAIGVAVCVGPMVERRWVRWRHGVTLSVPVLVGLVTLQAGWLLGVDWIKRQREDGRPLPAGGSPNVLLVVLDTVRADHLSLYGYPRSTTPNLERLAQRGIRFDQARTAAPWTLPSHATMFTGRWPHELDINWMHPYTGDAPTLAGYLGSLGYATAGFVGNTVYCSYDSGLDRGFTYYRDYVLDIQNAAHSVRLLRGLSKNVLGRLGPYLPISPVTIAEISRRDRKAAAAVTREFLGWLSNRGDPRRPFFAFLNYYDVHGPYVVPPDGSYRFGSAQSTDDELRLLAYAWEQVDKRHISAASRTRAIDGYDNCLAYVDEHLGRLFNDLQRRGVLDQTLVIVTADHGEGFGEHDLFGHGESLYRTEINVPLLIVLPADRRRPVSAVDGFVSLRDLAATVVDVIDPGLKSPFPGQSLARWWADRSAEAITPVTTNAAVRSELATPNPTGPKESRSPAHRGALVSLAEGDFVYIRNQGDGSEELFNERVDPGERHNLAGMRALLPELQRFRSRLPREMAPTSVARD